MPHLFNVAFRNEFLTLLVNKKARYFRIELYFWVDDGIRTHDPRHHKPML